MSDARQQQKEEENRRLAEKRSYEAMDAYWYKYYKDHIAFRVFEGYEINFGRPEPADETPNIPGDVQALTVAKPGKSTLPDHGWYPIIFTDKDGAAAPMKYQDKIYYSSSGIKPVESTPFGWRAAIAFGRNELLAESMVLTVAANPSNPEAQAKWLKQRLLDCIQLGVSGELSGSSHDMLAGSHMHKLPSKLRQEVLDLEKLSVLGLSEVNVRRANDWIADELGKSTDRAGQQDKHLDAAEKKVNGARDKIKELDDKVTEAKQTLKDVDRTDAIAVAEAEKAVAEAESKAKRGKSELSSEMVNAIDRMINQLDASQAEMDKIQGRLDRVKNDEMQLLSNAENVVWLNSKKSPKDLKSVDDVVKLVEKVNSTNNNKFRTLENLKKEQEKAFAAKQKLEQMIKDLPADVSSKEVSKLTKKLAEYDSVFGKTNVNEGTLAKKRGEIEKWYNKDMGDAIKDVKAKPPQRGFGHG